MNKSKTIMRVFMTTWRQFYQDNCFNRAAGLAYTTLLSLVPLLTAGFLILVLFPTYRNLAQKIQGLIFAYISADAVPVVQQYFLNFIAQTPKLSIIGMVGLLITAVLLFFSIEQTFNNIWRVERNRYSITAFLLYCLVVTFVPLIIMAVIGLGNYLSSLGMLNAIISPLTKNIFNVMVPYLVTFTTLTLLYVLLPNCCVPLGSTMFAAIIATILLELARTIFTLYIYYFAGYELIYGALAAIPIFLIWLYISWNIILFGVVLSYVLTKIDFSRY